jgi:hypothetical protein
MFEIHSRICYTDLSYSQSGMLLMSFGPEIGLEQLNIGEA